MAVRHQKPQGHTQRTPDPWWAITHGSASSISGEVSEVQGPQSRKHLKKDSVVTKPGEPVPGLSESEVARGSRFCSCAGGRAGITSCPPRAPPPSPAATAPSTSRGPAHGCPWPPHAGSHVLCCLTAVRGARPTLGSGCGERAGTALIFKINCHPQLGSSPRRNWATFLGFPLLQKSLSLPGAWQGWSGGP